jgi:hypothetical protein
LHEAAHIGDLKPDEVATIREAMIAAIGSDASQMPIECTIVTMPKSIAVTSDHKGGRLLANVTAV